jgi:hypothetical protein
MLSDDRKEFDSMMDQLCVGLGAVSYDVRKEAYWKGLAKMSLIQFGRVVEFCISEEGPAKVPTVPEVWKLWRSIQGKARAASSRPAEPPLEQTRGFRLVTGMWLKYVHHRRVVEKFKGDIQWEKRFQAAKDLAAFIDQSIIEGVEPDDAERELMFDRAMARVEDGPALLGYG